MKKFNLILLTLIGAVPAGYLVYLMVLALTLKHIWTKPLMGGMVVFAGVIGLIVAVWPPLYAIAFYRGPAKSDDEPAEAAEALDDAESAEEAEEEPEDFPEEDIDAFEGEETSGDDEDAEFKPAETGTEFDLDEAESVEDFEQEETGDFQLDDDEALEDLDSFEDLEEEEEEAPKTKKKKK